MPFVDASIQQVARLTQHKDRDSTDRAMVGVLLALAQPRHVVLYEVVGLEEKTFCLQRICQDLGEESPQLTSAWEAWNHALPLQDMPDGAQAMAQQHLLAQESSPAGGARLWLPLVLQGGEVRLLALEFDTPWAPWVVPLVDGLLATYRNVLNLLDYCERDTLTSLLNRKSFDEVFYSIIDNLRHPHSEAETSTSSGQRQPLPAASYWIGVIDVDHFKRVNDEFGHLIGDEVLLLIARLMRSTFRHADRLYRFGGEEFVVLLRAHNPEQAHMVFERFRKNVQDFAFPQVGHITASIGYTQVRASDTPPSAFERADKVVYLAKSQGRNQIRGYELEPGFGSAPEPSHSNSIELF